MDTPENDLQAIRQILAELTTRVYRIERRLQIDIPYFLMFAFDNNCSGPTGRVTIGILAGIAIVIWSERFRLHGYKAFSYSLKAVGIGALYLSLWAAFHVYSLVPSGVAFGMMVVVTAATAVIALSQDA